MAVLASRKWELFAQGLSEGRSQAEAYVCAGYGTNGAAQSACTLLKRHPEIRARTDEILIERKVKFANAAIRAEEELSVTIKRILQESARIAYADVRKAFNPDGTLKAIHEMDDDTAACIAAIEVVENFKTIGGRVVKLDGEEDEKSYVKKLKFWDKNAAHDKLMRYLGMFVERIEHGKPGEFAHMTEVELEQHIRDEVRALGLDVGRAGAQEGPDKPGIVH